MIAARLTIAAFFYSSNRRFLINLIVPFLNWNYCRGWRSGITSRPPDSWLGVGYRDCESSLQGRDAEGNFYNTQQEDMGAAELRRDGMTPLASGPTRASGAVRRMLQQSFETSLSDQLAA